MEETKVIYYIDDEETPYLVKIPISPEKVTLLDFKNQLNRPNYKFFFKSMDDDFGVVKEEIVDDNAHLPCFNGRVVSWLVSAEGSNPSDGASQCTDSNAGKAKPAPHGVPPAPLTRDTCTDTDSTISSRPGHRASCDKYKYRGLRINGHSKYGNHGLEYETASVLSSDLDSTSLFDSQSEITTTTGRHTNASVDRALTECSSVSHLQVSSRKRPQKRRKRPQVMSRTSSYSSITDSTMSMHIITVTLNMDTVNFLGISIVGQSNKGGDGGIYVGSIMKGGAVALDGRIEPGDMILQVNDVNFEDMTNDEAVRVLREVVQKPGPIKLVVAKCWDPNPKGYFTIPRTEPVRPIDPGAWVAHTQALREAYPPPPPSLSALPVSCVSGAPSVREQVQSVWEHTETVKHTVQDNYHEIRDRSDWMIQYLREEENKEVRYGAVAMGGLTGFIFGLRGGIIRRLLYTGVGTTAMGLVCFPEQTQELIKNNGAFAKQYINIAYNFLYGVKPGDPQLEVKFPELSFPKDFSEFVDLTVSMASSIKQAVMPPPAKDSSDSKVAEESKDKKN